MAVALTSLGPPALAGPAAARATPTRVSTWTAPATVVAGAPVRAAATVASAGSDAGRTVALQQRRGSGWATVATSRTDSRGRVQLVWWTPTASATQTSQLRVSVARAGAKPAATSATRTVSLVGTADRPAYPAPDAAAYVAQTLDLVNAARAQPRRCGTTGYPAAGPLSLESRLGRAATDWAAQMGARGFFAHEQGRSTPDRRIEDEGYRWGAWGENIAAGYHTPEATVAAWLGSTGHCQAIMDPGYTQVGVGYVVVGGSPYGDYWVLDFGRPR